MEENETNKTNNVINKNEKHIMFSYSWDHKHNVRHIYDIINDEFPNIPKWIDISEMSGNIIEAMNKAVEDAFIVIIFLSKSYKISTNCKIESELICGKQKKYLLVLVEKDYPYLENDEKDNWVSKMFKNQFYIDLSDGMNTENLNKLKQLLNDEINKYYNINNNYILKRRPSFTSKKSPIKSPIKGSNIYNDSNEELDNFILKNNLDQKHIDNIKDLIIKTPRTMIPTLKAEGFSFKSMLNIINDIKNE
tara:strand:- start:405 stop:1151 length:747 start_codon:yes stop_codon:yes gene_type:complete